MPTKTIPSGTVADAYLQLLADRGIDYLFANAGTDFAPLIEAYAKAPGARHQRPQAHHRPARERRHQHGAGLLPDDRPPAGGDGARQCRHRERDVRADQFLARQHPRAVHLGPHALCGGRRPPGRAQRRDPLAAGDARSARDDARIHEVGLRAPQRPGAGIGHRPRAQHRDDRAARTRLHDAAARSAGRADRQFPLRLALAPSHAVAAVPGCERDR